METRKRLDQNIVQQICQIWASKGMGWLTERQCLEKALLDWAESVTGKSGLSEENKEQNPLCQIQSDNHLDRRFIDSDFLGSDFAII